MMRKHRSIVLPTPQKHQKKKLCSEKLSTGKKREESI